MEMRNEHLIQGLQEMFVVEQQNAQYHVFNSTTGDPEPKAVVDNNGIILVWNDIIGWREAECQECYSIALHTTFILGINQ